MARRSPLNPRYQKHAKVGSTKKSASSLKPKREAGSAPSASSKPKQPAEKKRALPALPTSPEIQRWRRIWWALFAVMIVTAAVSYLPSLRHNATAQRIGMAVLTGAFFPAMYIELVVIRRLRNDLIKQQKGQKKDAK
ncbi:MAG: hypothetical protein QMD76_01160 [Anaerosomatales bacterium]|nr:hypothetical protein [Anaerosomatales bacterium]MDI6843056.1 hypothetical protein [Anaerosomatales bacterium]